MDPAPSTGTTPLPSPSQPAPWQNPVKALLAQGKPAIGITITVNNVEVAAQAADLGFDFLWIEMEHSPISLETLRNIVLATRGLRAVPFARLPVNTIWSAKRVLDAGVLGVMFPFSSTPELARQAADACRYPPLGKRGSGAGLASFRWPAPQGYYDFADQNVISAVIIEEVSALDQIEEIAAVPGYDVLFLGPGDMSFSMGLRGDMAHPRVTKAMERVVEVARKHGKFPGRIATSPEDLRLSIDQGFQFIQTLSDLNLMAMGAAQLLAATITTTTAAAKHGPGSLGANPKPAY